MKKLYVLILLTIVNSVVLGQATISLKLDSNGEDATIDNFNISQNNPNEVEYFSGAWTIGGTPVIWRNLFKFDFSALPSNAVVQSAYLNLHFAPLNNFGAEDTSLTNSNESVLQRITGSWTENSVNWINQPSTSQQNQIVYPASTSPTQDYMMTDVTLLVQDILNSGTNNGFMLKLQNELPYARMIFASGDYPDPSLHPELIITYTQCSTFILNADGEDATIDTYNPGNNYPNEIELNSDAWTIFGTPVIWRSLFKFDLSTLPANAIITSSHLSLFYADTNNFGNAPQSSLTNSNESYVSRILDPWSENAVTWNNQPAVTAQNQITLSQSITSNQDYIDMDVTGMVQDMFTFGNNGFMLKLTNESFYAQMLFASGDNPDQNNHPQLQVCYTVPTSIPDIQAAGDQWNIYPNPTTGDIYIIAKKVQLVEIFNSNGELISTSDQKIVGSNLEIKMNLQKFAKGIYCVRIYDGTKWMTRKIILQ